MDHRVSKSGIALCIVLILIGAATFAYLNQAFEGPGSLSSIQGHGYELVATFKDTEALPTKQPVLSKGVQVGKVTSVSYDEQKVAGTVTFTVDDEYAPIYKDASVRIGERSVLGDPYLDLDFGTESAGEMPTGTEIRAVPSVDFDEAFDFLDEQGRRHLDGLIETLGKGSRDPENGYRINGTVGGLDRTLVELYRLTSTLRGQTGQLAGLVNNSAVVLDTLGSRESAIREIVSAGRITLEALADNTDSVGQALDELPVLLETGRDALAGARPLLTEARPLVAELRALIPYLEPAVQALGPLSRDTTAIIDGLEPLRIASEPALSKQAEILGKSKPVVDGLAPGVRNLVPTLQYASKRASSVAAFFSNIASATQAGDRNGKWARFQIVISPGEFADTPLPATCTPEDDVPINVGVCHNAYPLPNDALNPEPFQPGGYPHILPYDVPPRPK